MVSARRAAATQPVHFAYDQHGRHGRLDILPGERIGSPLPSPRRRLIRRLLVVVMLAAAAGVVLLDGQSRWRTVLPGLVAALSPAPDRGNSAPAETQQLTQSQPHAAPAPIDQPQRESVPEAAQPSPPVSVVNADPTPEPAARSPQTAAASPSPSTPQASDAWTPPRPPTADEPHRQRAAAVGLHPDISAALLSRLSADDYRNAGIAIRTALQETGDDAVHVWPRQREPGQALFRVHFVAGAPPACRRYVVVVTKDGWSTTALPMERCGIARKPVARK